MKTVVTRFPPSPTGSLHVGGARTALFNWLYARHTGGRFVLRIEDTDTKRSTRASADAIFESLEWMGIDWDEGPYFQSQRSALYAEFIEKLLSSGHAYYCTCSQEKLEQMRRKAMAAGGKPKYDGTCREKKLPPADGAVVRFKAPLNGRTVLPDVVKGNIVFENQELDDFILARSDQTPTYNFAAVVDDITMGINTIIRGDDHVMNTPKQILLYQALQTELPVFAHVPMVLGSDRSRLSKRHGAMSVTAYRDMGYLPDAFINYLARLGWSYGDQEFFTRQELVEKFQLANIGRSAGVFDPEKLLALNADHIMAANPRELIGPIRPFVAMHGFEVKDGAFIENVIRTLQPRSKTLKDMAADALFYFQDDIAYDSKAAAKFLRIEALTPLKELIAALQPIERFSERNLEAAFTSVMERTGLKLGKIAQPVRVALTGRSASPGIFEITEIIGKQKVLKRLRSAIEHIENLT
ncbi:MAG: glutamyl-Q tRNA(Asp) ligase [Deltaproteobacteria bacterium SG8_13]|nr:MAG: glutamyl-Q tRNA(Asp) ligase [Deltaproteobacteria bacterium SG8_13]